MVRNFRTNQGRVRKNGESAFSPVARALADTRSEKDGNRIAKVLGKGGPFTRELKDAVLDDHLWILEMPHLEKELKSAKKIMKALAAAPTDTAATALLAKMQDTPIARAEPCVVCPIWRHEHLCQWVADLLDRYAFERVRGEMHFVTIIMSFSESLVELEADFTEQHERLKSVVSRMSRKRRGVVMVGSLEPDLRSSDELTTKTDLGLFMEQTGKVAPEAGGWVLSCHLLVRVPHQDTMEALLDAAYPSVGYDRVRFERISSDRLLEEQIFKILNYGMKFPAWLQQASAKTGQRRSENEAIQRVASAFVGPSFMDETMSTTRFDLDAAMRQWAVFVDRLGPEKTYFSVESVHAQKWLSERELDYVRYRDADVGRRGTHLVEIHRDSGMFSQRVIQPKLKGRCRRLRSRPLKYDPVWIDMTDCDGQDFEVDSPAFNAWMVAPGK